MNDNAELKRLVDRVLTDRRFCGDENHKALADGVLALIADLDEARNGMKHSCAIRLKKEIERLKAELDCPFRLARHSKRLVEQLRSQAEQYDQALIKMAAERDQLKAENERLQDIAAELSWSESDSRKQGAEIVQLKAEIEMLRREREGKVLCDLELFETLRDAANTEADEHRQCMATYRPLRQASLDSVVKKCDDLLAAMGKGEQA